MGSRSAATPAAADTGTVTREEVEAYVAGLGITDPAKQQEAINGISRALQQFEALRAREGSETPGPKGLFNLDVSVSETPAKAQSSQKTSPNLSREADALTTGNPAALLSAIRETGRVSSIIEGILTREIPGWNIKDAIIRRPEDLAALLWSV